MKYQSLTKPQREQVAYLFADECFGADPSAYEYEVKGDSVVGRTLLKAEGRRQSARKARNIRASVTVREVPSAYVTKDSQRDAAYAIQSIARSVVERIIKSQSVEA